MNRRFLGPIKNPTLKDFIPRVGGALAAIVLVIFATRAFAPGHEGVVVMIASLVLIAVAVIQSVWHDRSNKNTKQRKGKK